MTADRRAVLAGLATGLFLPWRGAQAAPTELTGYIRTNWGADPWSRGAYSFVARDGRQRDRGMLGADWGRVYFAGEAMHPLHNSTVHAAQETGVRAARAASALPGTAALRSSAPVWPGLSAAHDLALDGHDVTVFEARNRIGGRILTDHSLGMPLDLGASWIHGHRRNPLTDLADSLDLDRVRMGEGFVIRGAAGRHMPVREAPAWLENVISFQHLAGADPEEVNLMAYNGQFAYPGRDMQVLAGMDALFGALHGRYDIRLGTPVSACIAQSETSVVLSARRAMPHRNRRRRAGDGAFGRSGRRCHRLRPAPAARASGRDGGAADGTSGETLPAVRGTLLGMPMSIGSPRRRTACRAGNSTNG